MRRAAPLPLRGASRTALYARIALYGCIFLAATLTGPVVPVSSALASAIQNNLKPPAQAARQATAPHTQIDRRAFQHFIKALWPQMHHHGISADTFRAVFGEMTPDQEVSGRLQFQSEFIKPVWSYIDSAVTKERIAKGRALRRTYGPLLARLERIYRVDARILLAIWGMETNYGSYTGNSSVPRVLATLAFADRKRAQFWREELIAALQIIEGGHIESEKMRGSWAGALGHVQFMPSNWHRYAVDFDGDGRKDIWNSIPDALASAARFLSQKGWAFRKNWGYEVHLPARFDYARHLDDTPRSLAQWKTLGLRRTHGRSFSADGNQKARLVLPAGARGPAFLMMENAGVLRRYNNAFSYILATGHLADKIGREPDFATKWPRTDGRLSRADVKEIQRLLQGAGHDAGQIDGRFGSQTRRAMRAFQQSRGLLADGYPDPKLIALLRAAQPHRMPIRSATIDDGTHSHRQFAPATTR